MENSSTRPWGNYEVISEGKNYKVKKITVIPGGKLSLQKHKHRDEEWVIVKGNPTVTLQGDTIDLTVGDTVSIYKNEIHRIENNTNEDVVFIEVQIGEYLGEDDIIRLEDKYGRK